MTLFLLILILYDHSPRVYFQPSAEECVRQRDAVQAVLTAACVEVAIPLSRNQST